MAKVIETLDGLEGKRELATIHPDDPDQKSPAYRFAERMFKLMDDDGDGEITVEEFVKGFHKLKARQNTDGKGTYKIFIKLFKIFTKVPLKRQFFDTPSIIFSGRQLN